MDFTKAFMWFLCVHTWVHTKCEWIKWEQSVNNIAFTQLPLQCKQYLLQISSPKHSTTQLQQKHLPWHFLRPPQCSCLSHSANYKHSTSLQCTIHGRVLMFDLICQCETFKAWYFRKPGKFWIMKIYKQYRVNRSSPNIPNYKNGPKNQHQLDVQSENLHTSPFRRALTSSATTPVFLPPKFGKLQKLNFHNAQTHGRILSVWNL